MTSRRRPNEREAGAHASSWRTNRASPSSTLFPAWFDGESCWDAWRVILKPQNPARWRGHLDHLLPKQSKLTRSHHAAMPYEHVAAFVGRLRENDSLTAQALELTILTAARSGETAYGGPSSISIKGFGHCPRVG